MYRGQIGELRRAFERRFGGDITNTVDFNTVDGFQGQEKDIIILSCVRAGPGLQTVGFLRDVRRMNVALTRAKSSLFVLGHAPTLERSDDMWRKIVNDARTRSRLIEADVSYFTAPNPPAKAPLLPSKPPKPSPKNVPPVPPDLMLPRELKSFINRAPAPNVGGPVNAALRDNVTARALPGPPNIHEEPRVGHKRPASDDESQKLALRPNVEPEGTASDKPRLKPPLAKRPKKAPSLFIPKQKRPAPDAGEGGPANSRRRI
ncbi:hypothetical protein A0H81_08323 [Grifola frondosa]|uniref:DNA2/NAM7 helicase-like C-terminal domain-containing protein n=1 Tax=Grifola frondosa TaxID=5627 RepID=A0A1C7M571_GRIFR|nr:hypothetical protein A0H81_08323 [Grifola frondosa]